MSSEEVKLQPDDMIVSKTDPDSRINYASSSFCFYSGYDSSELIGAPHNIVRHPDMPRALFDLMWSHLRQEQEFFGYIKNLRKDGRYYWTFACVAPVYEGEQHVGYMSTRRCPSDQALAVIVPLYERMQTLEQSLPREQQIPQSAALLWGAINKDFKTYAEFVLAL